MTAIPPADDTSWRTPVTLTGKSPTAQIGDSSQDTPEVMKVPACVAASQTRCVAAPTSTLAPTSTQVATPPGASPRTA